MNARRRCVETRALPAGGCCPAASAEGPLRPAPDLPDPAGELARDGGVCLARALARRRQCFAAAAEPGGAVVGARPDRGGDVRAGRRGLRAGRARQVVPCRLHQRRPGEAVARLGYPAAPLGLAARVLGGREPAPAREGRRRPEPRERAGLGGETEGREGVDPLDAGERLDGRSPLVGPRECVSSRGFEQKEHRKLSSLSIGSAHAF